MIALIHGPIRSHDERSIVVDVNGVGYRVNVGSRLLDLKHGTVVDLSTHLHVTDDALELYGFQSTDELGLFQSLIRVNGVGPKSAMALLNATSADELRKAIMDANVAPLLRVSGIGKKTAERIILELSGTLAKTTVRSNDEAVDALIRLGYTRREASEALEQVDPDGDVRDRIREALKNMHRKP
jgi:Holliday junction DNA helicase RuvA